MTPEAQQQALLERALDEIAASVVSREALAAAVRQQTTVVERTLPILEQIAAAEQLRLAEETAAAEERGRQAARVAAEQQITEAEEHRARAQAAADKAKSRKAWRDAAIAAVTGLIAVLTTWAAMRLGVSP